MPALSSRFFAKGQSSVNVFCFGNSMHFADWCCTMENGRNVLADKFVRWKRVSAEFPLICIARCV